MISTFHIMFYIYSIYTFAHLLTLFCIYLMLFWVCYVHCVEFQGSEQIAVKLEENPTKEYEFLSIQSKHGCALWPWLLMSLRSLSNMAIMGVLKGGHGWSTVCSFLMIITGLKHLFHSGKAWFVWSIHRYVLAEHDRVLPVVFFGGHLANSLQSTKKSMA